MATSYFISAVGLNGNSPWLARGMDIGIQPLSSGGGRCCGPAAIGEQKTPLFGPGSTPPDCSPGPIAYCSWGQVRPGGSIGHDATRLSVGRPVIPLVMFSSSGVQMEFSMAGPLGGVGVGLFDCNYSTPLCMETPSGVPWGGWEGELPHGNPGCASPGSYSGERPPDRGRLSVDHDPAVGQRAGRARAQAAGMSAGMSARRTRRESRGRTSARYSTGLRSASAQQPRTV